MNGFKLPMQESMLKEMVALLRSGFTVQVGVTEEVQALCGLALVCCAVSLVLRIFRR